jgi:hypothetical protein
MVHHRFPPPHCPLPAPNPCAPLLWAVGCGLWVLPCSIASLGKLLPTTAAAKASLEAAVRAMTAAEVVSVEDMATRVIDGAFRVPDIRAPPPACNQDLCLHVMCTCAWRATGSTSAWVLIVSGHLPRHPTVGTTVPLLPRPPSST